MKVRKREWMNYLSSPREFNNIEPLKWRYAPMETNL